MKKVFISDSTLLREEGTFGFKESIEIARQLEKLNVDVIEIPQIQNTAKDILLVKTISAFVKNSIISVDAGRSFEDVDNAIEAMAAASHPRLRVSMPLSDVGMEYGYRKKAPAMIKFIGEIISYAKNKIKDVEFCAIDATRADKTTLSEAIKTAVASGANTITLFDNEGVMLPDEFSKFVENTIITSEISDDIAVGVCSSNANGLACANTVMSLKGKVSLIKTAVNSTITPSDTLIDIIRNCGNNCGFESSINLTSAKRIMSQINWIVSGNNDKVSFSTVDSKVSDSIMLDKADTIDTVNSAVSMLGYDLSDEDLSKVHEEISKIGDKKKVGAKELDAIVASVALQVPTTYSLVSYVINSGNILPSSAQMILNRDGDELQGISIGDGPIDAAFRTIEQIIGRHYELDDFQIQSVTEGQEAMGSALVKLRNDGKLYCGKGISTDIIGASIRAYISALNKIVYEEV